MIMMWRWPQQQFGKYLPLHDIIARGDSFFILLLFFFIGIWHNLYMQIIYKIDIIFISIYTILILLIGSIFTIASQKLAFLGITLFAEIIYLFFAFKKPYKRFRALKQPMPKEWKQILARCSSFYRNLDEDGKNHFEKDTRIFLSNFSVEGLRRQPVDIKLKLLVASGFAAMLHGRPDWEPPIKDGVLVYPGERFNRDFKIGKGTRAGQAAINSPLIVTEKSLEHSFRNPDDGFNVIYHELAHYFDLEDGHAEGIPSSRMPPEKSQHLKNIIHSEWQKALQGNSFLGTYAGTNEAEAFAVAVEFFFENPSIMNVNNPELYNALKDFFNIDTLSIISSNPKNSGFFI
jgi:Mlc titration factor MtfA (ptsG expression regulator)